MRQENQTVNDAQAYALAKDMAGVDDGDVVAYFIDHAVTYWKSRLLQCARWHDRRVGRALPEAQDNLASLLTWTAEELPDVRREQVVWFERDLTGYLESAGNDRHNRVARPDFWLDLFRQPNLTAQPLLEALEVAKLDHIPSRDLLPQGITALSVHGMVIGQGGVPLAQVPALVRQDRDAGLWAVRPATAQPAGLHL